MFDHHAETDDFVCQRRGVEHFDEPSSEQSSSAVCLLSGVLEGGRDGVADGWDQVNAHRSDRAQAAQALRARRSVRSRFF